jgi:hypothetical protein
VKEATTRNVSHVKPTPYQRAFLRRHKAGIPNAKSLDPATWPLVGRCEKAGWITIEESKFGSKFPWWWESTTITEKGIEAAK